MDRFPGLAEALADAPGPEHVAAVGGECPVCVAMAEDDSSTLVHPWHVCQVCGQTMKAWPHRINHYIAHHEGHDPRWIDGTDGGGGDEAA